MTPANRALAFIVPGDPDQAAGGSIYDRRIVAGLRALGLSVDLIGLDGVFPHADAAAASALDEALAAVADRGGVVIDGLAMGALPQIVGKHANRLSLVALIHHPLADETGLDADTRARLLALETRALAAARTIVVTSEFTRQRLAALGMGSAPVQVVEPGVDAVDPAAHAPDREDRACRLLCVATVTPRKGHDVLVDALAGLRDHDWQCDCIGALDHDPVFAANVARRIERAGLGERLRLRGPVGGSALRKAYARADLFVLASHYEGYGMVITEALAHGLPIVTTTGGALAHTLPAGCGLAVPPGDAKALSRALALLIGDAEKHAQLRNAAIAAGAQQRRWPQAAAAFAAALPGFDRCPA